MSHLTPCHSGAHFRKSKVVEFPSYRGRTVLVVAMAAVCFAQNAWADDDSRIVRVEEDWVLDFGQPDPDADSPQVLAVMSPNGDLDGGHVVFELNHRTQPNYQAGGLQLQRWYNESLFDYKGFPNASKMHAAGETVTFTMSMSLDDCHLKYEVLNGTSSTWGNFGGQGYLKTRVGTSLDDLSGYSPAASVKFSRVAFAAHRVERFVLKKVRYYSASGQVTTDSTERVAHCHCALVH